MFYLYLFILYIISIICMNKLCLIGTKMTLILDILTPQLVTSLEWYEIFRKCQKIFVFNVGESDQIAQYVYHTSCIYVKSKTATTVIICFYLTASHFILCIYSLLFRPLGNMGQSSYQFVYHSLKSTRR